MMVKSFKIALLAISMLAVGNAYTMATRAAQAGARAVQTTAPAGSISWARVWRGLPNAKNVTIVEAQEIARNAQKAVREGGDPRVAVRDFMFLSSAVSEAYGSGRKEASTLDNLRDGIFQDLKKYMPNPTESKQRAKDALAHPKDLNGILKAYREMEASQLFRFFLHGYVSDPEAYKLEEQLREYVKGSSPEDID